MTDKEFLATLKPDDKVVVSSRHGDRVDTVVRLTKTQIIVGTVKYQRDTGRMVGSDTWSSAWLQPFTEEKAQEIQLINLRNHLFNAIREVKREFVNKLNFQCCKDLWAHLKLLELTVNKE